MGQLGRHLFSNKISEEQDRQFVEDSVQVRHGVMHLSHVFASSFLKYSKGQSFSQFYYRRYLFYIQDKQIVSDEHEAQGEIQSTH